MTNGENVSVPVADLALSAERMADQAREIARLEEALGRALEQRDALLRLVEGMKEAAGVENAEDPISALIALKAKSDAIDV